MDVDRLIQIATELKALDQHREGLLTELRGIASGGGAAAAPRRGRPPGSKNHASAVVSRGPRRPAGSQNQAKPPQASARGGNRRSGITAKIVEFIDNGGGRAKKDKARGYRAA